MQGRHSPSTPATEPQSVRTVAAGSEVDVWGGRKFNEDSPCADDLKVLSGRVRGCAVLLPKVHDLGEVQLDVDVSLHPVVELEVTVGVNVVEEELSRGAALFPADVEVPHKVIDSSAFASPKAGITSTGDIIVKARINSFWTSDVAARSILKLIVVAEFLVVIARII